MTHSTSRFWILAVVLLLFAGSAMPALGARIVRPPSPELAGEHRLWLPVALLQSLTLTETVLVPAGEFTRGCDNEHNAGLGGCEAIELPPRRIYLDAYRIDRTEVTNEQYLACVRAGGCETVGGGRITDPPLAQHPVIGVTWHQADAYCKWAGRRLPTEAEWEKAARGSSDTRPFPWGENLPNCSLANSWPQFPPCVGGTAAVGSYPAGISPHGVFDMAGNAAEWVNDWRDYYDADTTNPTGPVTGSTKVIRGGSWQSGNWSVRVTHRAGETPGSARDTVGFRCAMTP